MVTDVLRFVGLTHGGIDNTEFFYRLINCLEQFTGVHVHISVLIFVCFFSLVEFLSRD